MGEPAELGEEARKRAVRRSREIIDSVREDGVFPRPFGAHDNPRDREMALLEMAQTIDLYERAINDRILAAERDTRVALEAAKSALYDAMHAGNLSRAYHDFVIVKIERALKGGGA